MRLALLTVALALAVPSTAARAGALVRVSPEGAGRLAAAGGEPVAPALGVWRLETDAARRLAPILAGDGVLLDVEPERARPRADHAAAGDPILAEQWWLGAIGAAGLEPPPAPGVPVVVIDSGLDAGHEEFSARPDTTALNAQTIGGPREFHGTAVASVVGAPANGVGVVGLVPRAAIASWDASPGGTLTSADVVAGIDAASRLGRSVINLSVGGPFRSRLEALAVRTALARGSLVVAAAGNDRRDGDRPNYPASLPHVLTTASVGRGLGVSDFSSSSPGMDVAAPGEEIPVAVPVEYSESGYANVDGTSFAAPIVAAAAAWVWTVRPELDATQVHELLRRAARDLGPPGRDADSGFGLLDLPAALAAPAPRRDPQEPNDDAEDVAARPLLTSPNRRRASIVARIDAVDDPRDVYRAWVPRGRRLVVRVGASGRVGLSAPGPRPAGLAQRRLADGLELVNRGRAGRRVLLHVFVPAGAPGEAEYRLELSTAPPR